MSTVRLRHPELPEDQAIEVAEAAVPVHRAAGWVVVEDPGPTAPVPQPPADVEGLPEQPARKRRRGIPEESD